MFMSDKNYNLIKLERNAGVKEKYENRRMIDRLQEINSNDAVKVGFICEAVYFNFRLLQSILLVLFS